MFHVPCWNSRSTFHGGAVESKVHLSAVMEMRVKRREDGNDRLGFKGGKRRGK